MGVGGALRELGRFLDECEQRRAVDGVSLADDADGVAAGRVSAEIELTIPTRSAIEADTVSLGEASVDDGGGLVLTLETPPDVVPERPDGVDVEPTAAAVRPNGTLSVTLTASTAVSAGPTVDEDPAVDGGEVVDDAGRASPQAPERTGPEPEAATPDDTETATPDDTETATPDDTETATPDDTETAAAPADSSEEREVPPFRDDELLREVYDSCDTFAEMSEEIGMDVTAETVRRYMMDAGIHEPNSYDTVGAGDAEATEAAEAEADLDSPVVLTDGIGLPDDVTVETLVETVKSSSTVYEVRSDIGVSREAATRMLRELDLLGHVVGRLATEEERDVSRELVVERLREHAQPR